MLVEGGDVQLLERAASGDRLALRLILAESRERLRDYLSRRVPADLAGLIDAEDIVQEAHIEVFRRIEGFEPRGAESFFRWEATMAMNLLRNAVKWHRCAKRGGQPHGVVHG